MKRKYSFQLTSLAILLLMSTTGIQAQTETLPDMTFPSLPYTPKLKKGWVGQYVYEIKMDGKSAGLTGVNETWYSVKANNQHSGFIEFPMEVRGAIRVNQPDKNNGTRWESWIRSGSSKSWSNVDVLIQTLQPMAGLAKDGITGKLEKTFRYGTGGTWADGWLDNTDLQIDHTEGKYSFAVPYVSYKAPGTEKQVNTVYKPLKVDSLTKEMSLTHDFRDLIFVQFPEWNIVTGDFKEGQQEIIIRKRIPLLLQQTASRAGKDTKLSAAKGYMDFYMVLKRIG